jgi:hypothetical protein
MFAAKGTHQDIATARAVIVLAAIVLVVYWRSVLRLVIMIVVIAAIALLGAGAFELFQGIHA